LLIPTTAKQAGTRPAPDDPSRAIPHFRIEMREFLQKVHRDFPATRMWGYESASPGPTFDFEHGQDAYVEWVNLLPIHHMFAVDQNLHGAENGVPQVRTVVHVHGARVAPESDGFPESWFTQGKSALYYYPNRQDAATLWYHDHALGITRLNIFAGLFGAFLIREPFEDELNLPSGRYEIPLMICDRSFDRRGQLNYPIGPLFHHPWVPEFSGNAILVNGRLFPYLAVEARRYRFRITNVSNGRILRLTLSPEHPVHQIATDQGLLDAPIEMGSIQIAPAERADVMLDFSALRGRQVVLQNDNHEVMQFRVSSVRTEDSSSLPQKLRSVQKLSSSRATRIRMLTLDEYRDPIGRITRSLLNATRWSAPVTETPTLGSVEIWGFINLTKDAHPIHLHGVRFQILDRRAFDAEAYQKNRTLKYAGPLTEPSASEAGWKDTVRADPGMVTRIIVRFEAFAGLYSWHCHILEHEDNEMMRPLEIRRPNYSGNRS